LNLLARQIQHQQWFEAQICKQPFQQIVKEALETHHRQDFVEVVDRGCGSLLSKRKW
jgi:hypothetical protein